MKIIKTTEYNLKFQVEYFEGSEGGMDHECYGPQLDTIEQALEVLESARNSHPNSSWQISVYDTKTVTKK